MKKIADMIKASFRRLSEAVTLEGGAGKSVAQRRGMLCIELLFAFYVANVFVMHAFLFTPGASHWLPFLSLPPATAIIFCAMRFFFRRYGQAFGIAPLKEARSKLDLKLFAIASSIVFIIFLWAQLANYPGGAHVDIYNQWQQVQTGAFDNWHPAFNAMLMWLVTRIVNKYAFFIGVQILFFSLLCGYMAATLRAWGVRALWVAIFIMSIVCSRGTRVILLYAAKDTLFTCAILWIAVYIINILLTKGEWLKPWPNRIALAVALAFVSMVRHNGIFFSIPLAIMLFAVYGKKRSFQAACSCGLTLVTVFLIRVPLYRMAGVTQNEPNQTYVESVGLPMTILSGVYRTQPEALDPEARKLMQAIAPEEVWEKSFQFGNYASILYAMGTEGSVSFAATASVPPLQLLAMTWRACKNAPDISLRAALMQTRIVWSTHEWDLFSLFIPREAMRIPDTSSLLVISPESTIGAEAEAARNSAFLQACARSYQILDGIISAYAPNRVLQSLGVAMLVMVLIAWFSLRRRFGWETLLPAFPVLAYNIGTMLMLRYNEYRYFHFNLLIALPFLLVLTARPPQEIQTKKKKNP